MINNSPKVEFNCPSTDKMYYVHNISLRHKREYSNTCFYMNKPWRYSAEWKKTPRSWIIWSTLSKMLSRGQSIELGRKLMVFEQGHGRWAGWRVRRKQVMTINKHRVSHLRLVECFKIVEILLQKKWNWNIYVKWWIAWNVENIFKKIFLRIL